MCLCQSVPGPSRHRVVPGGPPPLPEVGLGLGMSNSARLPSTVLLLLLPATTTATTAAPAAALLRLLPSAMWVTKTTITSYRYRCHYDYHYHFATASIVDSPSRPLVRVPASLSLQFLKFTSTHMDLSICPQPDRPSPFWGILV